MRDCKHGQLAQACPFCEMERGIERLRAEIADAYAEVHKQVAVSKVIFDRALVNRAKASLATPSEESKCKKY